MNLKGNFSIEIQNYLINIESKRKRREMCINPGDTLFNRDEIEKKLNETMLKFQI